MRTASRRPAAMDAARRAAGTAAAGSRQPSRIIPSAVHPLQRYAAAHRRARAGLSCRRRLSPMTPISSPIRRATTMRCTASSIPTRRKPSTIRAMRTTPTPIRTAMTTAPKSRSRSAAAAWSRLSSFLRWRWWGRARRLPIAPMSDRRAAASRRSSRLIPVRPRSCRRRPTRNAKVPDRMAAGDGTEKIVPREEAPVDVNAKSAPRVVFPPLNQNANPPTVASVAPSAPAAGQRRKWHACRTTSRERSRPFPFVATSLTAPRLPVDGAAAPAAKPAAPPHEPRRRAPPAAANANASAANAPLSLSPQAAQPPAAEPPNPGGRQRPRCKPRRAAAGGGGYLVQVSSQRNEADAQASYRALQGKFPAVLGSRSPVIKRADLGERASTTAPWSARSARPRKPRSSAAA